MSDTAQLGNGMVCQSCVNEIKSASALIRTFTYRRWSS